MTFVRLAFFPGATEQHFASLAGAMGTESPPTGRVFFAAGPVAGGWQVVQAWTTRGALDQFNRAEFLPALARLGPAGFPQPPTVVDFEAAYLG